MSLSVDFARKEDVLLVRLVGELDHHEAEGLKKEWKAILNQHQVRNVILNLEGLDFMDSSGLGVILGRYKEINAMGGEMVICSISPEVKRLFDLSGMFKIMKLVDNEEFALEMLGVAS
ncbi:anti-sigma F factor antagonist [Thalassobacillus devorans]|mgnify:CR=1 FL=1|uniref:Anti-sigma F factor antagonist n=1 Tax=Thalassobacillus devorans TaxID=279813 RepID=A0ABQ1NX72_9BACI|nr:anti-sigma F factor antagonist [Thalassobacillus devorans]NIK28376.1 stage II sporulation protein AA (anti-sigma F factor antagonist) [Thalassobacillus devorans]GGC86829.1 anti-sigma F factor antagonist [Thalassobacillus devorans]